MAKKNGLWPPPLYSRPFNALVPEPSPQPASPQAESDVVSHPHGKATSFQTFDEYAFDTHTIGFQAWKGTVHGMQKSLPGIGDPAPGQAVPQNLK